MLVPKLVAVNRSKPGRWGNLAARGSPLLEDDQMPAVSVLAMRRAKHAEANASQSPKNVLERFSFPCRVSAGYDRV
ncbi:MAG: hypothetical protein DWQ35_03810 [Planctomycetota bacterium]|nr:MAG: hypothetical protein DWQ35_03810 [Planctomycetota bacterium]REK22306.1 MAG: hypothetical protein DWQ42_17350 [Planctomycetota bacterium]